MSQSPGQIDDSDNAVIAENLRELADLLEQQQADGFRVMAYRHAAESCNWSKTVRQQQAKLRVGDRTEA